MTCERIPTPGGGVAIICGRGQPRRRRDEDEEILDDIRRQMQPAQDPVEEVARLETEANGCPDCTVHERRDAGGKVVGAVRRTCPIHRELLEKAYRDLEGA